MSVAMKPMGEVWGFYGHRLINRTAVFTLPIDLMPLFKANIDYITEQSVAPDKRRHASPLEAIRHYIDIDHWGEEPFDVVPRRLSAAMLRYGTLYLLDVKGDTLNQWNGDRIWSIIPDSVRPYFEHEIDLHRNRLMEQGAIRLPGGWLKSMDIGEDSGLYFRQGFSDYGILPYHLISYQNRLTRAFRDKEWEHVLRLSAELGHYIADGHVPLHTTENYNGQMTGQKGIHAFWESRLPELFAEAEFDLFTGRAKYIEDVRSFYWEVIRESHVLVEEVLSKEMALRQSFDRDEQYCFEERGIRVIRQPCEAFSRAYQASLNGMVEDRMRDAIAAIGSAWYTAWVDAGRPLIKPDDIGRHRLDVEIDPADFRGDHIED